MEQVGHWQHNKDHKILHGDLISMKLGGSMVLSLASAIGIHGTPQLHVAKQVTE